MKTVVSSFTALMLALALCAINADKEKPYRASLLMAFAGSAVSLALTVCELFANKQEEKDVIDQ